MDVECFSRFPRFISDSFQIGDPLKEIAKGDVCLHPRERGSEAKVDTVAEDDVRIRITGDVEFFRPFKVF